MTDILENYQDWIDRSLMPVMGASPLLGDPHATPNLINLIEREILTIENRLEISLNTIARLSPRMGECGLGAEGASAISTACIRIHLCSLMALLVQSRGDLTSIFNLDWQTSRQDWKNYPPTRDWLAESADVFLELRRVYDEIRSRPEDSTLWEGLLLRVTTAAFAINKAGDPALNDEEVVQSVFGAMPAALGDFQTRDVRVEAQMPIWAAIELANEVREKALRQGDRLNAQKAENVIEGLKKAGYRTDRAPWIVPGSFSQQEPASKPAI